jgi:hypothetical protein
LYSDGSWGIAEDGTVIIATAGLVQPFTWIALSPST